MHKPPSAVPGIVLLLALIGSALPQSASAQVSVAANPGALESGSITGTIIKPARGKLIEGVTVRLVETGQSVKTDKYGNYSFSDVKPGTYTVLATGDGYSRLRITDVVVQAGHSIGLSPQEMPIVLREGEVQMMDEVVVSATREIQTMEKYVVTDSATKPLAFEGTSNVDLPRTIDDVQPYYMWNAEQIDSSGAVDIQDFFQKQVPMNTNRMSSAQSSTSNLNFTNINIGGFGPTSYNSSGTTNTLILVNGLPMPSASFSGTIYQPNVAGIPLNAIDHIEVLPSSSSGIYGPNATGGVVNIVMKHDYVGASLNLSYNNTFGTDAPVRKTELTLGENLEGGKTTILLSLNYQTTKPLLFQDRSQVFGPYDARYFSLYPGGELAYLGLQTSTGAVPTGSATVALQTPVVRTVAVGGVAPPLFAGGTATQLQIPVGYAGFAASGAAPLQAAVGSFDLDHPSNTVTSGLYGSHYPIMQAPVQKGATLNVERQMTPWLQMYANYSYNSNAYATLADFASISGVTVPATAPGNPFGKAVTVSSGNVVPVFPFYDTENRSTRVAMGAKLKLPGSWKADLNYSWSQSNFGYKFQGIDTTATQAAVNAGAINVIADLSKYPLSLQDIGYYLLSTNASSNDDLLFRAVGPLMKLWAGEPTLSLSLEHNMNGTNYGYSYTRYPNRAAYNGLSSNITATTQVAGITYYPGQRTSDDDVAAEVNLPVVAKSNRIAGIRSFEFQLVGREDRQTQFTTSPQFDGIVYQLGGAVLNQANGSTVNGPVLMGNPAVTSGSHEFTVGFKYMPVDGVTVRGSYTSGFDQPQFYQLQAPVSTGTFNIPTTPAPNPYPGVPTTSPWSYSSIVDPVLGVTYSVPVKTGGNPALQPEQSHAIDWGLIFEPAFLKGFRISVDYNRTTKFKNIVSPPVATMLANPSAFPGRIQRASPAGPVVLIDDTYTNNPETYSSIYNFEVDYSKRTATFGNFQIQGIGSTREHYRNQSTIGGPFVESIGNPSVNSFGTVNGVAYYGGSSLAKFKGNLNLSWNRGPYSAGWGLQYTGPYTEGTYYGLGGPGQYYTGSPAGWISGQLYHNVWVGYKTGKASENAPWWQRALASTAIRVGVNNVFDHIPPYDGNLTGFPLLYSSYGDIRLATYILSLRKDW